MKSIILLLIIALAAITALAIFQSKTRRQINKESWPFYAKKVFSQPKQVLYFRLLQALPEHIILAQVQLSQILGIKKGNNYQAWLNRINRLSADFVICNKDTSVITVIELDDKSHQQDNRREADAKKKRRSYQLAFL
ncbi:MAG TPA: DUF2726 domain-containing protein [Methylococcus sp.]|nr:DUF2726 domain-containing protein [Methylococcus sp.]